MAREAIIKGMSVHLLKQLVREMLEESEREEKKSKEEETDVGRPMKDPDSPLAKAIEKLGVKKVATAMGASIPHTYKMARGDTGTSVEKAVEAEKITQGEMPVEDWIQ